MNDSAGFDLERAALRMRIYIGERDHLGSQPLYTAIVERARRAGLAGATVVKGIEGFGAHSVVHAARVIDLSSDLPIVIELIDAPDTIRAFVPVVREMVRDGTVTLDDVTVVYTTPRERRR